MGYTMLGCVRKDPGQLVVEEKEVPAIEEPTDVLIKVRLCTICGTDLHVAHLPLPDVIMGHEVVGEIVDVGEAVAGFQEGDRVVVSCTLACGQCASCQGGDQSACLHPEARLQHGMALNGFQAQYARVPFASTSMCRVPDVLKDEEAILTGDIFSTGVGVLERAPLRTGDSVAVFAQGPLGLCVTAAARALGAGLVIAVEPNPFRREVARKMGANIVLDPGEGDVVPRILDLTDGYGVHVAVEAVGKEATLRGAFGTARIGGAITSLGVYGLEFGDLTIPASHNSMVPDAFYHRRFVTTLCPSGRFRLQRLMDLIRYGRLDFTPLWTHRLSLADILQGYEMATDPAAKSLKIAVRPFS
ncbi:MAG: alcohol dehydrogenase catalytic domain-containing protein [bacterium]